MLLIRYREKRVRKIEDAKNLFHESFGLRLQNLNFICVIGTVESYLGL